MVGSSLLRETTMNSSTGTNSHIIVRKHVHAGDENCLYIKVPGYKGILATHDLTFIGHVSMVVPHDHTFKAGSTVLSRDDVKEAVKDYLEKDSSKKETPEEQSTIVADYTGDTEYKNCVYISSSNGEGYVVNPISGEFMGFASAPDSALTEKLHVDHPYMIAIKEYLFNKEGFLEENGLIVSRYTGKTYSNHVSVKTKSDRFLVCCKTITIVASITPSGVIASSPFITKELFKNEEEVVTILATVRAFLGGKRSPPKLTLKDHLEPFRKEYLETNKINSKYPDTRNVSYYSLVGKIVTTIPPEFVEEIFSMYPHLNRFDTMKTVLHCFLGEH